MNQVNKILMVGSEAASFVKTGGLADVLGALPEALVRCGNQVAVVMPRYRGAAIPAAERIWENLPVWCGPHHFRVAVDRVLQNGVSHLFVECPPLYDRPGVYNEAGRDYPDNHIRFAVLCHAALGIARYIERPDIIHCHDWQAALLPVYQRLQLAGDPTFFGIRTVFTIHNLGYMGRFARSALRDVGLDEAIFHPSGLEFWGDVALLKGGVIFSDAVTTVSPTYAREIQTPEFGFGLDGLLRQYASKLSGILNGADYREWNPEHDPHIAAPYSANDLSGKLECKKALLAELGLPQATDRALIGIISRFAAQKGFDIFADAVARLAEEDCAFAVLGTGDQRFEDMFRYFAAARPDKFGVRIGFDNALAHRIEAGADMFLMPSRYEPCGLSQIYSLRYGTVPIVRATGGLEDSVNGQTGFKFAGYSGAALAGAVHDAVIAYKNRDLWRRRMISAMQADFSWDASAAKYSELYKRLAVASSKRVHAS
jgi:starch synthase